MCNRCRNDLVLVIFVSYSCLLLEETLDNVLFDFILMLIVDMLHNEVFTREGFVFTKIATEFVNVFL